MSHAQGTTLLEAIISACIGLSLAFINSGALINEIILKTLDLGWVTFQGLFVAVAVFVLNKWLKKKYK